MGVRRFVLPLSFPLGVLLMPMALVPLTIVALVTVCISSSWTKATYSYALYNGVGIRFCVDFCGGGEPLIKSPLPPQRPLSLGHNPLTGLPLLHLCTCELFIARVALQSRTCAFLESFLLVQMHICIRLGSLTPIRLFANAVCMPALWVR